MTELNYERDIIIDEQALDVEWLDQAKLMMRYAAHAERVNRDADFAKERLDVCHAELDKAIRSNPERFGIAKLSEGAITGAITLSKEFQELNQKLIDARFEAKMAAAAVRAFDQRKTALENLVRLHAAQYFAGPRIPRDLHEEVQRKRERSNEAVGMRMMNRRKDK